MNNEFILTHDQQTVFDLCEGSHQNILVHGKPGTGKSVVTRSLKENGVKHYAVAAPTGLAAINIGNGAKTLHSLFGIQPSEGAFAPDFNRFTQNEHVINNVYHRLNHLIIDEISMVRADMLDYIDRELQHIKGNDLPFGGIQVICVGDFFQLPPVTKPIDKKQLKEYGYDSEFAFDAFSFKDFKVITLNEVLRQSDKDFIELLHSARTGEVTDKQLKLINKRVGFINDFRIKLAATNAQADLINMKALSLLRTEEIKYEAIQFGYWPAVPAEKTLTLKVGAQVIIKKNNADKPPYKVNGAPPVASGKIVNGTICKIVELPTKENDFTIVELEDGSTHKIYKTRWELKEKRKLDGAWIEEVKASYEQHPFQLAWAISMHKSQGQSFDKVHIDASRVFAAGQLYVALSRCRTLGGISLQAPIKADDFWTDDNVMRFHKQNLQQYAHGKNSKN